MIQETGITNNGYNLILKDVSKIYEQSLNDGTSDWNKTILASNFKIGKRIVELKQGNKERASYGDKVLVQLSKDLNRKFGKGFSISNLKKFRKFYQYYKSENFYSELSWSHYVPLLQIEDKETRQKIEEEAIQKKLSSRDLFILVKKNLAKKEIKNPNESQNSKTEFLKKPILKLHTYRVIRKSKQIEAETIPHLDLGFSIFQENTKQLSKFKIGAILESFSKDKDNRTHTFQATSNIKELYTYKAYLERVIDGDTILVNFELGFSVLTKQRLRLRGIDTAELFTKQGISAKKFTETELKDCKFLIIKTHSKDKYDRYLVDIFYSKDISDEDKVMKDGLFLNNELLRKGLALRV